MIVVPVPRRKRSTARAQGYTTNGTFVDPSNVVAGTPDLSGGYAAFVMENPGTVSQLPNQWGCFYAPAKDVLGVTRSVDLKDLFRLLVRTLLNTPPTDAIIGAVAYAGAGGPPSAATKGVGHAVQNAAGQWQPCHLGCAGAGWTLVAGSAAAAVVGGETRGDWASATQRRIWADGIDSNDDPVAGTLSANALVAAGDGLDMIAWGAGWATGIGGAGGTWTARADLVFGGLKTTFALAAR